MYYSIGDVARELGESVSLIRYWSDNFSRFVKPVRTGKGDRKYSAEDIDTLRQIHFLVKDRGLTLDGAKKVMSEDRRSVESRVKAIECLKAIRKQLVEVKLSL